jgi:hypothetical protein
LRAAPVRALRLLPEKFVSAIVPFDWEVFPDSNGGRSFNVVYLLALVPAGCGALTLWRKRAPFFWVAAAPLVAVTLQTMIFYGSPRFRLMGEPSLLLFSSVAVRRWVPLPLDRAHPRDR